MADRELPPLRVRILGDDSSLRKTIKGLESVVDKLNRGLDKHRRAEERHQQSMHQRDAKHQQTMQNRQRAADAKHNNDLLMGNIRVHEMQRRMQAQTARAQQAIFQQAQLHNQRMQNALLRNQQIVARGQRQAQAHQQSMQQKAQMHHMKVRQMIINNNRANAFAQQRYNNTAIIHQLRVTAMQAAQQRQAAKHQQSMQRSAESHALSMAHRAAAERRREEIHQQRLQSGYYTRHAPAGTNIRINARGLGGRGGGGMGRMGGGGGGSVMGAGLTDRADIYMHTNALHNMARSANDFLSIGVNFRRNAASIEIFTKDAQKARDVLADLRQFAIDTPYGFQDIVENSTQFFKDLNPDEAVKVAKAIGEVAGGDKDRYGRIAYAYSQIIGAKRLMGTELRQLNEALYDPLVSMEKGTGIPREKLREMMGEGKISHQAALDALLQDAGKGGSYAGTMNRQMRELGGIMSKVREQIQSLALDAFFVMEEDLKNLAKRVSALVDQLQAWLKANPELFKQIVNGARKAFMMVAGFHAMGLAIALVRWNLSQLLNIFKVFRIVAAPAVAVIHGLGFAFSFLAAGVRSLAVAVVTGSWLRSLLSLGGILGTVLGVGGGLGIGIAAMRDMFRAGAFDNLGKDFATTLNNMQLYAQGFFANFGQNFEILIRWISSNWSVIFDGFKVMLANMAGAWLHNMGVMAKGMLDIFLVAMDWWYQNLPQIINKLVSLAMMAAKQAVVSGAKAATSIATGGGLSQFGARTVMGVTANLAGGPFAGMAHNYLISSILGDKSKIASGEFDNDAAKAGLADTFKSMFEGFRHGMEGGNPWAGLQLPGFNTNLPPETPLPDVNAFPGLPEYTPDWSKAFGAGTGEDGGKNFKYSVSNAMGYHTGEYRAKWAEYADRLNGTPTGTNPVLSEAKKHTQLLAAILKVLPGGAVATAAASTLLSADIGTVRIP